MYYDVGEKFYELQDNRVFYLLLTGMTYREIANKFYHMNLYKFVYKVRKLMREFNLQNRRQLAYFAVKNHLISIEKIKEYVND